MIAYAIVHLDGNHSHIHLIISANLCGQSKKLRLSRGEFAAVERDLISAHAIRGSFVPVTTTAARRGKALPVILFRQRGLRPPLPCSRCAGYKIIIYDTKLLILSQIMIKLVDLQQYKVMQ